MKFDYSADIPVEVLPILQKYLQPLEWLVPRWCETVSIAWTDQSDEGGAICSWCNYEYRNAAMRFYPAFLSEKDEELRQNMVIHDLLHAFSGVVVEYAEATIKDLLPEDESPKFRAHALRELTQRNESWVQDMATCIQTHLMSAE